MDAREFIDNYFNAYKHTSDYKDRSMLDKDLAIFVHVMAIK